MATGSVSARGRRYWLFPLCALLWLQAAAGIAAPTETSGYHRSSWTQLDGAPPDIWALAQDRAGTLWLGTGVGLYRFDGIQFEHFDPPQGQGFASSNITALHADARGRLWIGFYPGGISVLDEGRLRHYPPSPQLPTSLVGSSKTASARSGWRRSAGSTASMAMAGGASVPKWAIHRSRPMT